MSQSTRIIVDHATGTLVLNCSALAQSQPWETTREFVGRLLAADCVESVILDRARATISMRIKGLSVPAADSLNQPELQDQRASRKAGAAPAAGVPAASNSVGADPQGKLTTQTALREIVAHLRDESARGASINDAYASHVRLQLQKGPGGATAGRIVHALSGRIRVRHPLLRGNSDLSRHVTAILKSMPGIFDASASATTGSILIVYDQTEVRPDYLLSTIETALTTTLNELDRMSGPPVRRWIESGACLGLAVASEFVVPGLAPLTAIALVASNLPTLGRGIAELATLKWRIPALYTVIMGTTLVSGQFLAAALMQASMTAWHEWSSRRLKRAINDLRNQGQLPILLSGSHHRQLLEGAPFPACLIGSTVSISEGSIVPYDGIIETGSVEVDEKCVRGIRGAATRSPGDPIFAGSKLLKGQLSLRVTAVEKETRASRIRETLLASVAGLPGRGTPTERSHKSASRIVPFTFATGTAAMMLGDLTTLAAVLRPDFATGPSVSERFSAFSSICHLWDEGWLIKDIETLHELARTRVVVIAHDVDSLGSPLDGESSSKSAATAPDAEVRINRRSVSFSGRDLVIHEMTATKECCADYVRGLRSQNRGVAVIGRRQLLRTLSQDDVILISSSPQECLGEHDYHVLGLHAEPQNGESLWKVLHETRRPMQQGWAAIVTCNALAISGAFLVGLTSLHVVLLTNLGALAAGLLHNRHFRNSKRMLSMGRERSTSEDIDPERTGLNDGMLASTAIAPIPSRMTHRTARGSLNTAWNARMGARRATDHRRSKPGATPVRAADKDSMRKSDPT